MHIYITCGENYGVNIGLLCRHELTIPITILGLDPIDPIDLHTLLYLTFNLGVRGHRYVSQPPQIHMALYIHFICMYTAHITMSTSYCGSAPHGLSKQLSQFPRMIATPNKRPCHWLCSVIPEFRPLIRVTTVTHRLHLFLERYLIVTRAFRYHLQLFSPSKAGERQFSGSY